MSGKATLFMETTEIKPAQTAGEIISELVRSGARSINTDYDGGKLTGLRWVMKVNGVDVLFDMPVRVDAIYKFFVDRAKLGSQRIDEARTREKAERVAWRQLLRWVQAQNAMIETGMVSAGEVFMPYMVIHSSGRTLFQHLSESQFKMLGAGG